MARTKRVAAPAAALALLLWSAGADAAAADGTETLGPPSVALAEGSGVAVGGVGLFAQPASLTVEVPADAAVRQVLLYWEAGHRRGDASGELPDDTIRLNGAEVTGRFVGGPTEFYAETVTSTLRADVTALGLVGAGRTTLTVDGLDTDEVDDGAGVVVIYETPGASAEIGLRDGNDIAFVNYGPPRDATVPQTFEFAPADQERTATLSLLASSLHDPAPGTPQGASGPRPHTLVISVGGLTNRLVNAFPVTPERELDVGRFTVTIPAGASSLTAQMVSESDGSDFLPASLIWEVAALAVSNPPAVSPTSAPPTTAAPTTAAPDVLGAAVDRLPATGPSSGPSPALLAGGAAGVVLLGAAMVAARRRSAR
ncbi:MAG: LPXTG cell wall anchor domain-containing protein [Acidimicrobiales bacterium]